MSSSDSARSESGHGDAQPLRIVQIVETLEVGGLETMAVHLAAAHRRAGHFSSIYTIFAPGVLADDAQAAGVRVTPFHKRRGFSASAVLRLARQLRADGAQIVHTHNSAIHHYGAAAARLAGAVAVNTRHGLALHSSPRQEVYFRAALPLTRAVVFVCDYGLRHYQRMGVAPAGRSFVIRNGIPLDRFQRLRARPGRVRPRIRFGTVGRLVEAKAHGDLLAAFASIAADFQGAELDIWGYGALQPDLVRRIQALELGGRVRYNGRVSNTAEVFSGLDVFVLSSISEGLPLVILEAMAAGLPIVSTRVGGVPEILAEGSAWLAEAGNPASLAKALREAAQGDLASAGEVAFRAAADAFTVEEMQRQYESLFRGVLGQRPAVGAAVACH